MCVCVCLHVESVHVKREHKGRKNVNSQSMQRAYTGYSLYSSFNVPVVKKIYTIK